MGNELALITNGQDAIALGNVLAKSGYFQDAKDAAQAAVKVLAGAELGIGPIAAMTGIYIVKGRVTMSANLMAAQIKRSGRYTYKIKHHSNEACVLEFFEKGESICESAFTKADATAAGLWNSSDPWRKTPRNMLFARAMSNGAKWFCPDIFAGPIYTPDELMADETQITVAPVVEAQAPPALPEPDFFPGVLSGEVSEVESKYNGGGKLAVRFSLLGYQCLILNADPLMLHLEDGDHVEAKGELRTHKGEDVVVITSLLPTHDSHLWENRSAESVPAL